jgi:hypothetical protein
MGNSSRVSIVFEALEFNVNIHAIDMSSTADAIQISIYRIAVVFNWLNQSDRELF